MTSEHRRRSKEKSYVKVNLRNYYLKEYYFEGFLLVGGTVTNIFRLRNTCAKFAQKYHIELKGKTF
jgi:hypothetical protein